MNLSALNSSWQKYNVNESLVSNIKKYYDFNDLISKLISIRVSDISYVESFIRPKIKDIFPDPFHLKDMDKAVERIIQAIKNQEEICIFADYDVDGATSGALIINFLNYFNIKAKYYIPNRINEGYGLSNKSIDHIKNNFNSSLIITVDCGVNSFNEIDYAYENNIDVIVIDHHLSADSIPKKAIAVINPNRIDENSEYGYLCAAGVVFLFLAGIVKKIKTLNLLKELNITSIPNIINFLDLVALGTVCDVMPVQGLNRAFITQGIKITNNKTISNNGLRKLIEQSDIHERISPYHLGFILGPKINAGSRMGKQSLGIELLSELTCTTKKEIIALDLSRTNQERQAVEQIILQEAKNKIEKEGGEKKNCIVLIGNWHVGVIGIIASRIKDLYNKPAIIISSMQKENNNLSEDTLYVGSCRSISNINIGSKIASLKALNIIESGGGHKAAAGFKIKKNRIKELDDFLDREITKDINKQPNHNIKYYDQELSISSLNVDLVESLNILEPFGVSNPKPIFCFNNIKIFDKKLLKNKHISMFCYDNLSPSYKRVKAISFNSVGSKLADKILSNNVVNIIGTLNINYWNDQSYIQIDIKDII
ncbi:MAG TPA: single-stranded-DNA-specific exonuclease RecJ [Candidatus Megaira endosymbiont of Hartmannula sinica]|nr:single-stranded-DNA-specific exonuclease RecJ [Candidatus Megaera endosymbiont of Hartmannula sinica]